MKNMLQKFLLGLAKKQFNHGILDCSFVVADWCFLITGKDPVKKYRDMVSTKLGCMKLIKANGDLCNLFSKIAIENNYVEADQSAAGDIAVVLHQNEQFGAIKTNSDKWAMMLGDGLFLSNQVVPVKIWKVI